MKITAQEEYGVRCLMRLARTGASLTIPEISAAENLSQPYVGKLLSLLRNAGLVESVRGRTGGYHLARPALAIRLGEVMDALGEPLFDDPGYCERHAGPETVGPCVHTEGCTLRGLWQTLGGWIRHVLDQVSIADLLESDSPVVRGLRAGLPAPREILLPLPALSRA